MRLCADRLLTWLRRQDRDGFTLLGTYPNGSPSIDTLKGRPSEAQMENIRSSAVPLEDPIFGATGAPWGSFTELLGRRAGHGK